MHAFSERQMGGDGSYGLLGIDCDQFDSKLHKQGVDPGPHIRPKAKR